MKKFLATIVATCVLCAFLVGCGGSSSNEAESYDAAFVGTWNVVEMSGDMTYDKDQMEAFRTIGLIDVFMNLDEGGKAFLCSTVSDNVSSVELTWKADSATQATLTGEGNELTMQLENGLLSLSQNGTTMRFEKVDHRDALPVTTGGTTGVTPSASDAAAAQGAATAATTGVASEAAAASSEPAAPSAEAAPASSEAAQSASSAPFEVSIDGVEVGADYNGEPALIVTYTWKNNTDETASYASNLIAKCFQNGVQLDMAIVLDGIDNSGYMAEVRPGYGTTFQMAYALSDTENPVEIEVSELFDFNGGTLLAETFEIK